MSDIIEAAARALADYTAELGGLPWEDTAPNVRKFYRDVVAAVTPLIRAAVLEEETSFYVSITPLIEARTLERAAQVAEDDGFVGQEIAVRIRALKEQP